MAAAAIYETLFTRKTIGQRDETTSSVLIDTLKDVYMFDRIDLDSVKQGYLEKKLEKVSTLS